MVILAPGGSLRRRAVPLAAALLLLAHAALTWWSATREVATFDEVPHVAAGYAHLVTGDFRLDPGGHPPLLKLLAGAAVRTLDPPPPVPTDHPSWRTCVESEFGGAFFYGAGGDGAALLARARAPFVLLGVALALAVFLGARALWGSAAAALAALALAAANPELLAHAHYANSDLGLALLATLFLWALLLFLERPTTRRGAAAALAFALAAATKFSFPALLAMGAPAVLLAVARAARGDGRAAAGALLLRLARLAYAALLASALVVWAAHGFRAAASPTPELACRLTVESMLPRGSGLRAALVAARDNGLVPEAYATGLAFRAFEGKEAQPTFLAGRVRAGGGLAFFPLALLLKTPLPLLALAALGALGPARPEEGVRARRGREALVLAALVYLGLAVASRLNIGYRHLLPLLPLLALLGGRGARLLAAGGRRGRWALALLLAWQAAGTLRVAPHFLSYFNALAGGPARGHRWLVDSSTDWGQDLGELGRLARRERLGRVKLSYFGSGNPDALGLDVEALPSVANSWRPARWARGVREGDVVAISVTNLRGLYFPDRTAFPLAVDLPGRRGVLGFVELAEHLDARYRPAARAGYSILVYRLAPEWERR